MWTRGLLPDPAASWVRGQALHDVHVDGGSDELGGLGATDGSLLNGSLQAVAQGGWAAVTAAVAVWGPLPFPRPRILLAELWAVLQSLRHSGCEPLEGLCIDNATVGRGLLRGRVWCLAVRRAYCQVWR